MKAETISLVQSTFAMVASISETAAEIFYGKLFEKDPSLKSLFKGDMKEQGKKLMTMIGVAVGSLKKPEVLIPVVQDLGKRHKDYGVTDEMYDVVGESLIETLATGLGDSFTAEAKDAWVEVYTVLATTMKEAAAS